MKIGGEKGKEEETEEETSLYWSVVLCFHLQTTENPTNVCLGYVPFPLPRPPHPMPLQGSKKSKKSKELKAVKLLSGVQGPPSPFSFPACLLKCNSFSPPQEEEGERLKIKVRSIPFRNFSQGLTHIICLYLIGQDWVTWLPRDPSQESGHREHLRWNLGQSTDSLYLFAI